MDARSPLDMRSSSSGRQQVQEARRKSAADRAQNVKNRAQIRQFAFCDRTPVDA
jgi:hypothetical protein